MDWRRDIRKSGYTSEYWSRFRVLIVVALALVALGVAMTLTGCKAATGGDAKPAATASASAHLPAGCHGTGKHFTCDTAKGWQVLPGGFREVGLDAKGKPASRQHVDCFLWEAPDGDSSWVACSDRFHERIGA
jgi:hypothetical protein